MGDKAAVMKRLRKVEGQIKGIQKMIDEEKFCGDVLIQVAAARAALNSVGGLIIENYMKNCLNNYLDNIEDEHSEESLDQLINVILKYTK